MSDRQVRDELAALAVPIDSVRSFERRARRSADAEVESSLERFGQYRAIVARAEDRVVIAGSAVLEAARRLGWDEVAVHFLDVDEDTAARIRLRDNAITDAATYDEQALADLLSSLPDLEGTGFDQEFLDELLAALEEPAGLNDPDDAPEAPARDAAVSAEGDVWLLGGGHRVMCGSATDLEHVQTLVAGATVDAVWTDPPYGVSYEGKTKDRLTIVNDTLAADDLGAFLVDAFTSLAAVLKPGGVFYVCSPAGDLETTFRLALREVGLGLRQQLVWVKDRFVLGRMDYHWRHETILHGWAEGADPVAPMYDDAHGTVLYGWAEGAAHTFEGGRKQDTVWECPRPSASRLHPTMKPVELVRRAIENSTRPGQTVLDLFAGSGSLAVAAWGLSRRSLSMELDPAYVDVICRRWQEHTGMTPVREATGRGYDFVRGVEVEAAADVA